MAGVKLLKYKEHTGARNDVFLEEQETTFLEDKEYKKIFLKKKNSGLNCFFIKANDDKQYKLETGYFIGVDWVVNNKTAIHISPKLNNQNQDLDYIGMLISSLKHPEVASGIDELFKVKWDKPEIKIEQKQDFLTPFLVVEFLSLLKNIVRKGLKKSYYKVEENLQSRVKGKVMVAKTIKKNLMQNKNLYTFCSYDEFGLNNKENRLLKKALVFVKRYLPTYSQLTQNADLQNIFNYINPAFEGVSDEIELNEIKHSKTNAFYKEYEQALKLAKLILKRFGYNISNTEKDIISTPPFWIDMSKLFELYVLGLLKDRFHNDVEFQFKVGKGNELDYLLNSEDEKMVIDAKYKELYIHKNKTDHTDMRQVSGYARLQEVYSELGKKRGDIINCLIIYPDQEKGIDNLIDNNIDLKGVEIPNYFDIYKLGIKLPII